MPLAAGDPIEHGRRTTAGALAKIPPERRSRRSAIAANVLWAGTPDRAARTAPGRRAFLDKFQAEVDAKYPDVAPEIRARMATNALKAHMQRMAYNREKARAARKAGGGDG